MDESHLIEFRLMLSYNLGFNSIGNKGAKLLMKADIPQLQKISLCIYMDELDHCNIGSEGAIHLSKCNWPALSLINLCN